MGPVVCWAAAGPAAKTSANTAAHRGCPIAFSMKTGSQGQRAAEIWVPGRNPLRALGIFPQSAQIARNLRALGSRETPNDPNPPGASAPLASPDAPHGSLRARPRAGAGGSAWVGLRHRRRQLRSGVAPELRAVRPHAIPDRRPRLRAVSQQHPGRLTNRPDAGLRGRRVTLRHDSFGMRIGPLTPGWPRGTVQHSGNGHAEADPYLCRAAGSGLARRVRARRPGGELARDEFLDVGPALQRQAATLRPSGGAA